MPTKELIRFWCKGCKDYTIQHKDGPCLKCGTVTESYVLSEVPEEKIRQQRERYKNQRAASFTNRFNLYTMAAINGIPDYIHSPFKAATILIETDAGQKAIEDEERARREKKKKEREELREEYKNFKGTGRNQTCPCGSGKKYKYCCQSRFNHI